MRIYLDHNASSPLRPVAKAILNDHLELFANPSSVHRDGQRARAAIESARISCASAVGSDPGEIIFTSGCTEACTYAIFGCVRAGLVDRIIVSAIEHVAVLETARASGVQTDVIAVTSDGVVDLLALEALLAAEPQKRSLVCVMAANNETGVIQPIAKVIQCASVHDALVFCDGAQALGKINFDCRLLGCDLAAFAGHKVGGPQGVGALYVRSGLNLAPLICGGGQEQSRRGGTEPLALIASFAAALGEAVPKISEEAIRLSRLRCEFEASILGITPQAMIVGKDAPRLANTLSLALPDTLAETLVIALDLEGIGISSGSACSSGKVGSSHVMAAMGLEPKFANGTIRLSLGWNSEHSDLEAFTQAWQKLTKRLGMRSAA